VLFRSAATLYPPPEPGSCLAHAANRTEHTHLRVAVSSVVSAPAACIVAAAPAVVRTAAGRTVVAALAL